MDNGTISTNIEWFFYLLILLFLIVVVYFIIKGVDHVNSGISQF